MLISFYIPQKIVFNQGYYPFFGGYLI